MSSFQCLIDINTDVLSEGDELLSLLQPRHYNQTLTPTFESSIGAHFRHVFEHYRCFFAQLKGGQICYDARERDQILERDLDYARRTSRELARGLRSLSLECSPDDLTMEDAQLGFTVPTSVERELLFLQSHTVHHFAIVAAISRQLGLTPTSRFGVALATRQYQATLAESRFSKCDSAPKMTLGDEAGETVNYGVSSQQVGTKK